MSLFFFFCTFMYVFSPQSQQQRTHVVQCLPLQPLLLQQPPLATAALQVHRLHKQQDNNKLYKKLGTFITSLFRRDQRGILIEKSFCTCSHRSCTGFIALCDYTCLLQLLSLIISFLMKSWLNYTSDMLHNVIT